MSSMFQRTVRWYSSPIRSILYTTTREDIICGPKEIYGIPRTSSKHTSICHPADLQRMQITVQLSSHALASRAMTGQPDLSSYSPSEPASLLQKPCQSSTTPAIFLSSQEVRTRTDRLTDCRVQFIPPPCFTGHLAASPGSASSPWLCCWSSPPTPSP